MSSRVKLLAVTTALAAAGGLAWLTSAAAYDGGYTAAPMIAQATPPAATPPAAGGGPATDRPMDRMREMRNFSPKDMCAEQVARRIGNRAYLKARLDLKPEQVPLWTTFEKAADEASAKDKARCATLPTEIKTPPSFMERTNRRAERLKARLDSIEAVKPSLQALYASLTPEQKAILDRPMMGRGGFRRHRG
jgi:hypothetical protein